MPRKIIQKPMNTEAVKAAGLDPKTVNPLLIDAEGLPLVQHPDWHLKNPRTDGRVYGHSPDRMKARADLARKAAPLTVEQLTAECRHLRGEMDMLQKTHRGLFE